MSYKIIVGDEKSIADRLNGAIAIGPISSAGAAVGAKTVIFSDPAQTVTFSGSAGDNLKISEIVDELKAVTGLQIEVREQGSPQSSNPQVKKQIVLVLWLSAGYTIDKDGTANPLLGINTVADTVSDGAIAAAKIKGFTPAAQGTYAVILED